MASSNSNAKPLQLGPERLIFFHSPDPQELGIQLEHGSDGYVRIISVPSDDDDNDYNDDYNDDHNNGDTHNSNNASNNASNNNNNNRHHKRNNSIMNANNGVIQGKIRQGDILCEAAGVNMRRPISKHMWKLTTGLMKVAQRPIEIVVAEIKPPGSSNDSVDSMGDDNDDDDDGNAQDGRYYQLEVSPGVVDAAVAVGNVGNAGHAAAATTATNNNEGMKVDAAVYHLPGSPGARSLAEASYDDNHDNNNLQPTSPLTPNSPTTPNSTQEMAAAETAVMRNPFRDLNRFGTERRITFHTESLGIKLHRSPTEGIVHVLTVTPFRPFVLGASNVNYKPPPLVREGPNNGHLEPGDTILEVGGVDLRGKAIGVNEWADMVHFIKCVGRPLEFAVSKDKLFTRERAGLAVMDEERVLIMRQKMEVEVEKAGRPEQKEGNQSLMDAREEEDETEMQEEGEVVEDTMKEMGDAENPQEENVQGASAQEAEQGDNNNLDAKETTDDTTQIKAKEEEKEEEKEDDHEFEVMAMENVCFNIAADDICKLPCSAGDGDNNKNNDVPAITASILLATTKVSHYATKPVGKNTLPSPRRKDNSWIKRTPMTPAVDYEDDKTASGTASPNNKNNNNANNDGDLPPLSIKKDRPWIKSLVDDAADVPMSPIEMEGSTMPMGSDRKAEFFPVPMSAPDDDAEALRNVDAPWMNDFTTPGNNTGDERNDVLLPMTPVEDAVRSNNGHGKAGLSPGQFDTPNDNDVSWINNESTTPALENEKQFDDAPFHAPQNDDAAAAMPMILPNKEDDTTQGNTNDNDDGFDTTWPRDEGLWDGESAAPEDETDSPNEEEPVIDAETARSETENPNHEDERNSRSVPPAFASEDGVSAHADPAAPPAVLPSPTNESSIFGKDSWHTALSSSPAASFEEESKNNDGGDIPTSPIMELHDIPSAGDEEEKLAEDASSSASSKGLFPPMAMEYGMPKPPSAELTPEGEVASPGWPSPNDDVANWPPSPDNTAPIAAAAVPPSSAPRTKDPPSDWSAASPISDSSVASDRAAAVSSSIANPVENQNDADNETPAFPSSPPKKRQELAQMILKEKREAIVARRENAAMDHDATNDERLITPATPPRPAADYGIHLPKLDPSPGMESPKLEPTPYGKQPSNDIYHSDNLVTDYIAARDEEQPATPLDSVADYRMRNIQLEPTPYGKQNLFDEANTTEQSHDVFLTNLRNAFDSPDATLQPSTESRDDITSDKHHQHHHSVEDDTPMANNKSTSFGKKHGNIKIVAKPEKRNHMLLGRAPQQQPQQSVRQHDLSPAGSTVSVGDKKKTGAAPMPSTEKRSNTTPVPFSERSFRTDGMPDSPFVGNIQFATPTQRVPTSALFSQAFVVQHPQEGGVGDNSTDVRWVQTDSPLFVVKKNLDGAIGEADKGSTNKSAATNSSYLQLQSPRMPPSPIMPDPCVRGFNNNQSAFDMSVVEMDEEGFELNETIVYADSTEDTAVGCCGIADALCGSENLFDGLMSNGGSIWDKPTPKSPPKEKRDRNPSPRRKNLLSRLRGKGKSKKNAKSGSNGGDNKNMDYYGNLDEDNEEREESNNTKGVRKAHVQLTYQNIRGQTMASANQFALLIDDEICV